MTRLLPVLFALIGAAAGGAAGYLLRPAPAAPEQGAAAAGPHPAGAHAAADAAPGDTAAAHGETPDAATPAATGDHGGGAAAAEGPAAQGDGHAAGEVPDYVKLPNQFVVPVVEDGRVAALVILSLSLEVEPGASEAVFAREPRLRDGFLQVLFDHANAGGFRGTFTDGANLVLLRGALREAAAKVLGGQVRDVLISDIVRQDS